MARTKRSKPYSDSPRSDTKYRRESEVERELHNEVVSRENRNFTQIYDRGWQKLNVLLQHAPSIARFWVFLVEQMDTSGVVVATQRTLAGAMGVRSTKTIQRWSEALEKQRSLVRVPLTGGIYAYALNPEEVWKAYDKDKEYAVFNTKSMANTKSHAGPQVRRKIKILMDSTGTVREPKDVS